MTFHAPHSNSRLMSMVAKRALFSRATIVAAAVVSTTVVLAGRGGSDSVPDSVVNEMKVAHSGFHPRVATHAIGVAPLDVVTAPNALRNPSHNDRKIVPALYRDVTPTPAAQAPAKPSLDRLKDLRFEEFGVSSSDSKPESPKPKEVRVASLTPSNLDWSEFDASLSPRLPELGPVPINPSVNLPDLNPAPSIEDLEARPTILSLSAVADETLELMLKRAELGDDDYRATLVALRADNVTQSLIEGDTIDFAFLAEDDRELLAIRVRQLGQPPFELRWDEDTVPLWTSLDSTLEFVGTNPIATEVLATAPESLSVTGKDDDTLFVAGEINSSLYASAAKAGLSAGDTKELSDIFRYSVDFERDLRKGDKFEALFEKRKDGSFGNILYAKLTNRGSEIALYRGVDDATGEVGYFDATGKTNKRSLMRTPVARAQVSSHFGMRHHPILGYNKMHRGTDFRAPRGTPIFAAGDGIVEYLGRKGAYGKYISIRHNSVYQTAYAHMSRYANGLNSGDRVRQGDVIGYVGSTGRSTGPHLHFEILEYGNQINPMNIADFGPTRGLSGATLSAFMVRVSRIEIAVALLRNGSRVATVE